MAEKDWRQASSGVESGDLERAIVARNNLKKMLQFVEAFSDMREEVKRLRDMMEDEKNLIAVYKRLKVLTHLRYMLMEKIQDRQRRLEIESRFTDIEKFEDLFFKKVLEYLDNHFLLATQQPAMLVRALRIIENDKRSIKTMAQRFDVNDARRRSSIPALAGFLLMEQKKQQLH